MYRDIRNYENVTKHTRQREQKQTDSSITLMQTKKNLLKGQRL